jgi:predicted nucleic acid-binding protein
VIIVDTNVISELMRPSPDSRVLSWLNENAALLAASVVTTQELTFGAHRLAPGAKRDRVERSIDHFASAFDGRILPLSVDAARLSGIVLATRISMGRPTSTSDAQIAGTALAYAAAIATRNTADFEGLGIELINPWT